MLFSGMFSLLFGVGFTIQFARMEQAEPQRAASLYLRRLAVLGVLGLVHACVCWTGDVLHVYALLGLLGLFPLRRVSDRTIVVLMGLCLLYPALSGALRLLLVTPEVTAMLVKQAQAFEISNNAAYGHGSFGAAMLEHMRGFGHDFADCGHLGNMLGWYLQMGLTMLARPAGWRPPLAATHPRVDAANSTPACLDAGGRLGLRRSLHGHLRDEPHPGAVADQAGRCCGVLVEPFVDDGVLRADHRTSGAAPGLGPPDCSAGCCRAHGADQLSSADSEMHNAVPRLGLRQRGRVGPAAGLVLAFVIFGGVQVL